MNTINNEEQLAKLQWQIQRLADVLPKDTAPVTKLAIQLGWGEEELNLCEETFDQFQHKFDNEGSISGFEKSLKDRMGISYQTVKKIVLAFIAEGMYEDVCIEYAKQNDTLEMKRLLRSIS
ncbi:MAG: hypothetical protein H6739_29320 [Alphaproteobacteria bacterium]|nr:hypothetical protein [Alphaproteobacteria bacterium]